MNCRTRNAPIANSLSADTLEFIKDITGKSEPVNSPVESESRANREQLEWLAGISPKHDLELRQLLQKERQAADRYDLERWVADITSVHEAEWDPAKHPRRGSPPNAGWFATAGSATSGTSPQRPKIDAGEQPAKFRGALAERDRLLAELNGGPTPEMIRARRSAVDLQTTLELPGEVTRAFGAGLGTGGKAVVNGSATAIKNVATLNLSDRQLELIGVTQADRDRGYDTAVSIATASGEVLIAVGTGGVASALNRGGTVARTTSGILVAFDAAGNAVGVVRGIHDASTNGVTVANGAQIAAGALGLGANARSIKSIPVDRSITSNLPLSHEATLGRSAHTNYTKTYFNAHPESVGKVIVHHGVEQQVLSRYPGVVTPSEIHSLENLRGIPRGINADVHLSQIRKEWNQFYKSHPQATKQQLLDMAQKIDSKYGHLFDPPIR